MTVLNAVTAEPLADPTFSVVGVGVGEGGLDAFQQLLKALPRNTGMAFVLVQHLESIDFDTPVDILARTTMMPVVDVRSESTIAPDHIYIVSAAQYVVIDGSVLKPLPRNGDESPPAPVDCFLQSLAATWRHRAIGIVLSGAGTDGTLGLEAIRSDGGLTFAQDESARHDGMSRSAINAGCVDFILPPGRMAEELQRVGPPPDDRARIDLLQKMTRRVVLQDAGGLPQYARLLERDPEQAKALYQNLLLTVTGFFRDPGVFDILTARVFPQLVQNRKGAEALRIWMPGCSTGEEAYSLAIAFMESIGDDAIPIQVFATDVDEVAIAKARAGRYPKSISEHVSPERLRRFFVETYDEYQISKSVRDVCVFARQNVVTDPPFSRIDLLACRTLLMWSDPFLQRRILPLLCHALRPSGVLGGFGTIGALADLFETVDARHRIYSRKRATAATVPFPLPAAARERAGRPWHPESSEGGGKDAQHEAVRLILANHARPAVLVNANLEIVQFKGDTSRYLTQPPGKPTNNLLRMARKGLLVGLRAAVQKALKTGAVVEEKGVRVHTNRTTHEVDVAVVPIRTATSSQLSLLVTFEERNAFTGLGAKTTSGTRVPKSQSAGMTNRDPRYASCRNWQRLEIICSP